MSVLLAVPLSLIGPVLVLLALRVDNNLYVQIGLVLLIALSAKNAILIVEVARELRAAGKPIVESAYEAARARFRPILMTSFAFILGVRAAGACHGRRRIGAQIHRHHRVQRHDRFDVPRGAVRAVAVRDRAALRGMAASRKARRAGHCRGTQRVRGEPSEGRLGKDGSPTLGSAREGGRLGSPRPNQLIRINIESSDVAPGLHIPIVPLFQTISFVG